MVTFILSLFIDAFGNKTEKDRKRTTTGNWSQFSTPVSNSHTNTPELLMYTANTVLQLSRKHHLYDVQIKSINNKKFDIDR